MEEELVMKNRYTVSMLLILLLVGVMLAACGLSPAQVEQAAATVDNMSASELANLSTTVEALPPEQVAAIATSAAAAGYANAERPVSHYL